MLRKQIQLGLLHVAVAMTLVPINSTLNRVMIKELAISATLVAILASLPYLFSPMQVAIGSYSDRHPILGFRRSPYILLGLVLCAVGVAVAPQVAFLIHESSLPGILVGLLAFGAWGMGYNFAAVSYFSLATEISGEKARGRTIAIMFFMMILSIIFTSLLVSRMVDPYSPEAMQQAFLVVALIALSLGLLGLVGLEDRKAAEAPSSQEHSISDMVRVIRKSPQVTLFFFYLFVLLIALLSQDILLEPFAAKAFGMSVQETTRITSIWGTANLLAILSVSVLEKYIDRKKVAQMGNLIALGSFLVIIASGYTQSAAIFYFGLVLLGIGTGISTVANLSLMFDLTIPGYIGLFIGAWGVANAMSRLAGNMLAGVVRDVVNLMASSNLTGYIIVFGIEVLLLAAAAILLTRIDIAAFHRQVTPPPVLERAALAD
jgi:BCD family chlorophyll transporter-like MFS transporter